MDDAAQNLFLQTLRAGAAALDIPLTDEHRDAFLRYAAHMLRVNAHTNLTRITAPEAMAVRHFLDALTVLRACPDLAEGATLADVGTGAGFPGVPLKIVRPDLRLTLIDSLGKRLAFLADLADALGLTDVTRVHARAEESGRDPARRDRYDLVTARAVAALPTLLEWCLPLVRVGGRFVAMKSDQVDDELAAAAGALRVLNARLVADHALVLPATGEDAEPLRRRLLVFEKTRPTPPRYPRRPAEIKQKPLG